MDELSERIAIYFDSKNVSFEKKKMFGGICFMVDNKMCVGTAKKDLLMVRLDPEIYEDVLKREGCREMDFTGRPMRGFVFLDAEVLDSREVLSYWLDLALEYNPKARSSKKKKK